MSVARFAVCAAAVVLATPAGATAPTVILINNGLAPPEPSNVIDASDPWADDEVIVRNAGCGTLADPYAFCDFPMGGTRVEVVEGGAVDQVTIREGSGLDVSGGSVRAIQSFQGAAVNVFGGSVELLTGAEFSNVVLGGGEVGAVAARDNAQIGVNDGVTVDSINGLESGEIRVFGGTVLFGLVADESSTISIQGGMIGEFVDAFDAGSVTILGRDFRIDGVPVPPGEITALSGTLTCELDSSEMLDVAFERDPTARIELVPEPGVAAARWAVLAATAGVARRRRGRLQHS